VTGADRSSRETATGLRAGGSRGLRKLGPLGRVVLTPGESPDRSRRPRRFGIDPVTAFDTVLMLCLLGAGYGEFDTANIRFVAPYPNLTLLFLVAMMTVPLLLRDRRPGLAWTFSVMSNLVAVGVARDLLGAPFLTAGVLVLLYCLYTVAARYDRVVTTFAWAVCMAVGMGFAPRNLIVIAIVTSAPVLLGINVRARRQVQTELVAQLHRHQDERAVLEERQRIARELHDVVAHHMSVIAIHAEAAPYKVADPPEELAESFADIRSSALEGLTELRRILGVLRTEDDPQTVPQPGLDRLEEIVASARNGGLSVTTSVSGEATMVPRGMSLSAYRILQEALSNAMKHAPGASVVVEVAYDRDALTLRVVNGPGPAPGEAPLPIAATGGGHGLVGMRERATMLGGELVAGPAPGGGFAVTATLPWTGTDAGTDRREPAAP
jgi:signal transduction histidine kinase